MKAQHGFTVLELLVASLLLGMLMTVLTMIFNQSSIAWRTGEASVKGQKVSYEQVADIRYKADNVYMWDGEKYIHSVFDENGVVQSDRNNYISEQFEFGKNDTSSANMTERKAASDTSSKGYNGSPIDCGGGSGGNQQVDSYLVNVMSWGPDRKVETKYDNIYSVSPSADPSQW